MLPIGTIIMYTIPASSSWRTGGWKITKARTCHCVVIGINEDLKQYRLYDLAYNKTKSIKEKTLANSLVVLTFEELPTNLRNKYTNEFLPAYGDPMNSKETSKSLSNITVSSVTLTDIDSINIGQCIQTKSHYYIRLDNEKYLDAETLSVLDGDTIEDRIGVLRKAVITIS